MNAIEFLQAVLPDDGFYCAVGLDSRTKRPAVQTFYSTIEELVEKAVQHDANTVDAYFAISAFKSTQSRKQDNVASIRALALDLDAYATKREAATALDTFLDATELNALGRPWILSSGKGLHVYWAFNEEVPIADWMRMSENMRRAAKDAGLLIDQSVVADSARVLRVPNTHNYKPKYGKPLAVKVLTEGNPARIDATLFAQGLRVKLNGHAVESDTPRLMGLQLSSGLDIEGKRPEKAMSATTVQLVKDSETSFSTIMKRSLSGEGCNQIVWWVNNAATDGVEPIFRGLVSWAKSCTNGVKAALKLGAMHPYDTDRIMEKYHAIKGPYSCATMDKANSGVCPTCPNFKKVTNPLVLGRHVPLIEVAEVIAPTHINPSFITTRPQPPAGFGYSQSGGVYARVKETDPLTNIANDRSVPIFDYDVWVDNVVEDSNGLHMAEIAARHPMLGETRVLMDTKAIFTKEDVLKTLAERNVYPICPSNLDAHVVRYFRQGVSELSTNRRPRKMPAHYGFQADNASFVYSGGIYKNGTVTRTPTPNMENLDTRTKATGSLEEWVKIVQMLIAKKEWDMLAIVAVGFGSIFMQFTPYNGFVFHVGATASGTGKSVCSKIAASIWGDPEHYPISSASSMVAMQMRMGFLYNLPLVLEEMTTKFKAEPDFFAEFTLDATRGQGKERAEASTNKERINTTTWKMLVIANSNTHQLDHMTSSRKSHAEGELRRMLELIMERPLSWTHEEKQSIGLIDNNYAVAGPAYLKWITSNLDTAKEVYNDSVEFVRRKLNFTDDERFCEAAIAANIAALRAVSSAHADIVDIPIAPIIESYRGMIERQRTALKRSVRSAVDIMHNYVRECYSKFIIVRILKNRASAHVDGKPIEESPPLSSVVGRIEHDDDTGTVSMFIEENLMKGYCAAMCFGYNEFKRQLATERDYEVEYGRKDLMAGTKGFSMRVQCLKIVAVNGSFTGTV